MFFNLAWRNSKRNRSENLIYFLTMVTAIATFYIVLSLGSQDVMRFLEEIESDAVNRLLTMLMPTVYLFSLLFVFFLVIFANKYQLECRSRELGLYLMFGMTKRHLFIQIMAEGLITSLLALLGGLICGGFLSEVISLATARLVGRGIIAHQSSFSVSAVLLTTLGFLMIQVVALFILCGKLFNKEIHQLLYGEMAKKQQVGKMSGNLFSLILGSFDACILGNPKVFHGCWRYDDNCCRDIRYCGNNAFYPWACRLAERSGGFCETQHNTRSIYFHSAAVTRKYSPQVYFNRCCIYFDYAHYHAHCGRINPHYVVWEPNDAGIFCLRFYRHGQ